MSLVMPAMTAWGAFALYYSSLADNLRTILAVLFAFFGVAMLLVYLLQRRKRPLLLFASSMIVLLAYWQTIEPRQDRDWAPEYARLAYATINGDEVTIHNIRNFDYQTETDFTPRYYTKTFDLAKLDSVDIIASYWAGDAIAHIIVSFGFDGTDFLPSKRAENAMKAIRASPGSSNSMSYFMSLPMSAISCACERTTGRIRRRTSICIESVASPPAMRGAFFSTIPVKSILWRTHRNSTIPLRRTAPPLC
jgi:hypothetical protein